VEKYKYLGTILTNQNHVTYRLGADEMLQMLAIVQFRICCFTVAYP